MMSTFIIYTTNLEKKKNNIKKKLYLINSYYYFIILNIKYIININEFLICYIYKIEKT